jgi:hypothetical protein
MENTSSVNFHAFGWGDAGGPIDSGTRGFTGIAGSILKKKNLDSRLRGGGA